MQYIQSAILLWEIGLSVCPSVCVSVCLSVSLCVCLRPVSVLCLNECTRDISLHLFDALLAPHSSIFEFKCRYNINWRVLDFSLGTTSEGLKAKSWGVVPGKGAATPSTPARGSGKHRELPQRGFGGAPPAQRVSNNQDDLS